MGMLREGYTCYAKLWNNSDDLTLIRWFPAAPGAKPFPGRHRFDTLYERRGPADRCNRGQPDPYLPDEQINNTDVGEQGNGFSTADLPRTTDKRGNFHGLTGRAACRPDLGFTGGTAGVDPPLTLDADGVPTCCQRAWVGAGGQKEGGSAVVSAGDTLRAAGGQKEGGSASMAGAGAQIAAGGQKEGGQAVQLAGAAQVGSGGQKEGGQAVQLAGAAQVGAGGQKEGGSATVAVGSVVGLPPGWEVVSMTPVVGGLSITISLPGLGNATFLAPGPPYDFGLAYTEGGGGQQEGGQAVQFVGAAQVGSGGQKEGGTTTQSGGSSSPFTVGTVAKGVGALTVTPPTTVSGHDYYLFAAMQDPNGNQALSVSTSGWSRINSIFYGVAGACGIWRWLGVGAPGNLMLTGGSTSSNNIGVIIDAGAHGLIANAVGASSGPSTSWGTNSIASSPSEAFGLFVLGVDSNPTISYAAGPTVLVPQQTQGSGGNVCSLAVGYAAVASPTTVGPYHGTLSASADWGTTLIQKD